MSASLVPALLLAALAGASPASAADAPAQELSVSSAAIQRLDALTVVPLLDWRRHPDDLPHGEDPALDDKAWPAFWAGERWLETAVWLRRRAEIPPAIGGYPLDGASVQLELSVYPQDNNALQLRLFVDGLEAAVDDEHLGPVPLPEARPGKRMVLAVKIVSRPRGRTPEEGDRPPYNEFRGARLVVSEYPRFPGPARLRDELIAARALVSRLPPNDRRRRTVEDAAARVDFASLDRGDVAAFDRSLESAHRALQSLSRWMHGFRIVATGHSHIDMAWLWPWTETVGVVRDTFETALSLMREYPDFRMSVPSVQAYAWMEEKYPALFQEMRARVKEGRWEPVGGMWVEPDLNLPAGESLVRQLLVGKRYLQDRFGVDVRVGWNPDSFGYNWQLPQIMKRAGIDYFLTQKLSWNDTTQFPYKAFWWQAPDGSRVLTYFPHGQTNRMEPERLAQDAADYGAIGLSEHLNIFGVGDHGGGPTRAMLDRARQLQDPRLAMPTLEFGTAAAFFDRLARRAPGLHLPVWNDELYLEFHRGVYTTQSEVKRMVRRSEEALLNAEKFAALASAGGREYPAARLDAAWKTLLFNQFHDLLPGSGIRAIYQDLGRDLTRVQDEAVDVLRGSLEDLAARIDTRGPGVPVLVFNPLAWARGGTVEAVVEFPAAGGIPRVQGPDGSPVVADAAAGPDPRRWTVRFLAQPVPSLGWAVYHVTASTSEAAVASALTARPFVLENEFLAVEIDSGTGCMTHLVDKTSGRDLIPAGGCGNLLQAFHDRPTRWDAWNIESDFEAQHWDLRRPEKVALLERGPSRGVIRVVQRFRASRFVQDVTLRPGARRVDIDMTADWHETHTLLKVAFPVAAEAREATYEIPFGSIRRPTTRDTPAERAKFEVPALRWADLSDDRQGLSLLNDSKYGYDAKGNVLRLSLLRSPTWPDPHTDQGAHRFTYSVMPHGGPFAPEKTVREGYELNYPLLGFATTSHDGERPASGSSVDVDSDHVVLTALKQAEDGGGWIVRFYESAGRPGTVRLSFHRKSLSAWETDLLERPLHRLSVRRGVVSLDVRPYEIRTIRVRFE